jgi:hypothetical protein
MPVGRSILHSCFGEHLTTAGQHADIILSFASYHQFEHGAAECLSGDAGRLTLLPECRCGILVSTWLLLRRPLCGICLFCLILLLTLIWGPWKIGLDGWALMPRPVFLGIAASSSNVSTARPTAQLNKLNAQGKGDFSTVV